MSAPTPAPRRRRNVTVMFAFSACATIAAIICANTVAGAAPSPARQPAAAKTSSGHVSTAKATGTSTTVKSRATVKTVAPKYTFDDEFNGAAGTRPTDQWTYQTGGNGWGNNEAEQYTNRASNASLDGNGSLAITARHETYTGSDGITRSYTSARLNSNVAVSYGYLEARIKLPVGYGLWPAFWTVGKDITSVGWPFSGEIDILESVDTMAVAAGTIHGPGTNNAYVYQYTKQTPASLGNTWHTYGMSWTATTVTWYLDGKVYYSVSKSQLKPGEVWEFAQPQYMILNLAVGGPYAGTPDSRTPASASMLVDWVHAGAGIPADAS